jgi:cytochrome P450
VRPLVFSELIPVVLRAIARTRWRPALPLGVPHATIKADMYDGYDIPKGATVFSNIEHVLTYFQQDLCHLTLQCYSILVKDPNVFDDPEMFNPSRFLTPHKPAGNWNGKVESDFTIPFGHGRRICPGMRVALQSIFISMAR